MVKDRVHVHDLHATILHLLGFDHTKLTYRFQGRDFRLTDVNGEVVKLARLIGALSSLLPRSSVMPEIALGRGSMVFYPPISPTYCSWKCEPALKSGSPPRRFMSWPLDLSSFSRTAFLRPTGSEPS